VWKRYLRAHKAEGDEFWLRRKPPALDPSYGDARLARAREAARRRDWDGVLAQLAAAGDGEETAFLVQGVGQVAGVERWIGEHEGTRARLVGGARQIAWAWQARGRGPEEAVPRPQFELFRQRLETAEALLREAADSAPEQSAPWYFLLMSGHALDLGADVARERFDAVQARDPQHHAAHRERLLQLPLAQMPAFAREATAAAPEGSPRGELVARAYLEQWRERGADPDSTFLAEPSVAQELYEAAGRSVLHPAFVRRLDWPVPFNTFALAFALAGERQAARHLFRQLGTLATEFPWRYLDDRSPMVPYLAWRTRLRH
jgi:hypothetical protein